MPYEATQIEVRKVVDLTQEHPFERNLIILRGYDLDDPEAENEQDGGEPILALAEVYYLPLMSYANMSESDIAEQLDMMDADLYEDLAHLQSCQKTGLTWSDVADQLKDVYYISRMVVAEPCRGQGLGARLLNYILDDLIGGGYVVLHAVPCELADPDNQLPADKITSLHTIDDLYRLSFNKEEGDRLALERLIAWYHRFDFNERDPFHAPGVMVQMYDY